ncbi:MULTISPECIES: sugar phosphate isomerase/epimerase family protein [Rhodococcus]|uniref:Sugar phosphate isomerase/epimerase n=1 Tax=Rhodococcus qingshengii JCM 15477 TaxID=1303681 RepID=A0AB38RMT0_RHOSG|nr:MULTISPECIES: hypothetical protein [Rhodococcus]MDA3635143.1 hypothetical protein [Rhodococcus sp. C-2]UPU46507.1 sugar phosphate isomerase/epimerase [Rhodococcus qingshengii JCM 15477]
MTTPTELIMWEGSVRTLTYREQLEATAEAGFDSLALTPAAFLTAINSGLGATGVKKAADDRGIGLHLDTVTGWAPIRVPSGADDALVARFDFTVEQCLELVDALDLRSLLAVAVFDHDTVPTDTLVRGFADLCDAALTREIPVNLEFMPFWGVPDLAAAWNIVERAQKPNSGLIAGHLAFRAQRARPSPPGWYRRRRHGQSATRRRLPGTGRCGSRGVDLAHPRSPGSRKPRPGECARGRPETSIGRHRWT